MNSPLVYFLDQLDASLVGVAGGKGASLGELARAGAPVPPAFVVSSAAFEIFMDCGDHRAVLADALRRYEEKQVSVAEASATVKSHLNKMPLPEQLVQSIADAHRRLGAERVSVRSSATCEDSSTSAWAGQLETFLDVGPADVLERVRACWLSLFDESALSYGAAHGLDIRRIAVAVVVQQMVKSDVSGIGFSVHPVTQEPNILLIEACLGLGEAIVSGRINPDQYIVDRDSLAIVEQAVGEQTEGLFLDGASSAEWRPLDQGQGRPKLTSEQVVEYATLLSRIHDHYRHPVDTEWALEDGSFRVLQARPITTLAAEYDHSIIDPAEPWQHLVRRPMSLVEVSIWAHWIDAEHAHRCLGVQADRALSIQDDDGLAHDFLSREATESGLNQLVELMQNDRPRVVENLKRGLAMLTEVQAVIERGADGFDQLDDAVTFFADVAQFTTVFPAWLLNVYEQQGMDDPEIRGMAEGIRSHTLYPAIQREIIDPLVRRATQAMGFSEPAQSTAVVTWNELRRGTLNRDLLESRLEDLRAGRRFVFQSIDGNDTTRFVSQTGYLLMRLARDRRVAPQSTADEIAGQAAWPGVYRGRARLVLTADAIGQHIEEGEVLVSIQSSPELMPLLEHCGAIVTDDGGIACHAAIISRELRKPTLIGTRTATSTIRTGDLVEVDTYAAVVRILERAGDANH